MKQVENNSRGGGQNKKALIMTFGKRKVVEQVLFLFPNDFALASEMCFIISK